MTLISEASKLSVVVAGLSVVLSIVLLQNRNIRSSFVTLISEVSRLSAVVLGLSVVF